MHQNPTNHTRAHHFALSRKKAERDAREAQRRADEEQRAIQRALDLALRKAGAEHSAEVEELRRQLAEAEARGQRAVAQAQLTKVGHVYVLSNIGSFGPNVYKVGLTRRLEPQDRVKELGDASVRFTFDVHMMIYSEDAPALEHTLHKALTAGWHCPWVESVPLALPVSFAGRLTALAEPVAHFKPTQFRTLRQYHACNVPQHRLL